MRILVIGGAGYIGSHTVLELIKNKYNVVVYDSLSTSNLNNLQKIAEMTRKKIPFEKGDILDRNALNRTMKQYQPDGVIHFAALKNAGESMEKPHEYYENNVMGSYMILELMRENEVNKIVFSSTSAVYGNSDQLPFTEDSPIQPMSTYGKTKAIVEYMLEDYERTYGINSIALRYFNAAGADESGKIGEDTEQPANIIPLIMETLVGRREKLFLFGDNYPTEDGTQKRDYIHVTDLARGHVKALERLNQTGGYFVYNLGTGNPHSNKELITLSEMASGKKVKYEVVEPRDGDPLTVYGDPSKAERELSWKAQYSIEDIIQSAWKWHSTRRV